MSSNKIIGVTIATPEYKDLAHEAASRFRKYSKLDTCVIDVESEKSYEVKFMLLDYFRGRKICFFDSDLFSVREFNLDKVEFQDVAGVNDPTVVSSHSFVRHDCFNLNIPFNEYLNTGFLLLNLCSDNIIRAFNIAKNFDRNLFKIQDTTEQSILNYSFQNAKCKVTTIPAIYNFFKPAVDWGVMPYIPRDVINVHAAGYPLHLKKIELDNQCKFFERVIHPLSDLVDPIYFKAKEKRGFIVTTEDQLDLAYEAKRRVFNNLNICCDIKIAKNKQDAHRLKLAGFLDYKDEQVYLIDNDLWFVDKVKLSDLESGQICATRSINKTIEKRSSELGIPYEKYFCSCFVGAYVDDKFHELIKHALELRGNIIPDEKFLNTAVRDYGYDVKIHKDSINWCGSEFNDEVKVKAFHAARKKDKFEWLSHAVKNFNTRKKFKHFKPFPAT